MFNVTFIVNVVPFVNGGVFPPMKLMEPDEELLMNTLNLLLGRLDEFVDTFKVYSPATVGAVALKLKIPLFGVSTEEKLLPIVALTFIKVTLSVGVVFTIEPVIVTLELGVPAAALDCTTGDEETFREIDAKAVDDKATMDKTRNSAA